MYRHGDVLLEPVDRMPVEGTPVDHTTLALGEATGHSHVTDRGKQITTGDAEESDRLTGEARKFLVVEGDESAQLTHEEHNTLEIPPGTYEVLGQREFDPMQGDRSDVNTRRVVD